MKRQSVVSLIVSALCATTALAAEQEYLELRTYQLTSPEKAAAFDKMLAVAVPALKKLGIAPVAVFKGKGEKGGDPNWRYVLTSWASLDTLAASRNALGDNQEFLEAADDHLSAEKSDPAYTRIDVSTFLAFEGFPKLVTPAPDAGGERFFELRIYESHSELKAFMKVHMFNNGEIDIFNDSGLRPVFFGSALSGANLPNLTYMLVYDNEAEHKKAWDAFRKAPAWKALRTDEKYKDTVSKISSLFLVATEYSGLR